jgi:hypothetical protein
MEDKNTKLIKTLLDQIEERDKVIKSLIRNIKIKERNYKGTILFLSFLLALSLIGNALATIYL